MLILDVQDAKEEELTLDPHAEMEKGDFSDEDFPEHEPMYQPFEETYEEEQAKQAETPVSDAFFSSTHPSRTLFFLFLLLVS